MGKPLFNNVLTFKSDRNFEVYLYFLFIYKELAMLESLKTMLKQRCMAAWEQMNRLNEVKSKLQQDLEDKEDSVQIDTYLLGIDKNCGGISYKPDPLRIPKE